MIDHQLSERHLNAARALMETLKPTTTMEVIVLKATCELLIETATALIQDENAKRLSGLRELCGHVEDGSSCVLKIFQDDATKDWFIMQDDKRTAYGRSFESIIDAAIKELT